MVFERWLRTNSKMCSYVSIYRNIIVARGKGKEDGCLHSIKDESNPPDIRN